MAWAGPCCDMCFLYKRYAKFPQLGDLVPTGTRGCWYCRVADASVQEAVLFEALFLFRWVLLGTVRECHCTVWLSSL